MCEARGQGLQVQMSTFISSTQSIIAHGHGYCCLQTRYRQDIILESFWTALRLRRLKGPGEASNQTKRVTVSKVCSVGGCIKNKYFLPRSANLKKSVPAFFVKNDVPSGY